MSELKPNFHILHIQNNACDCGNCDKQATCPTSKTSNILLPTGLTREVAPDADVKSQPDTATIDEEFQKAGILRPILS